VFTLEALAVALATGSHDRRQEELGVGAGRW